MNRDHHTFHTMSGPLSFCQFSMHDWFWAELILLKVHVKATCNIIFLVKNVSQELSTMYLQWVEDKSPPRCLALFLSQCLTSARNIPIKYSSSSYAGGRLIVISIADSPLHMKKKLICIYFWFDQPASRHWEQDIMRLRSIQLFTALLPSRAHMHQSKHKRCGDMEENL